MWIRLHGHEHPSLTLIGSPNYGHRSVARDLEAQVLLATDDQDLQRRLGLVRTRADARTRIASPSLG